MSIYAWFYNTFHIPVQFPLWLEKNRVLLDWSSGKLSLTEVNWLASEVLQKYEVKKVNTKHG